jgi:YgiT-type zinc finger domain-containing protein
MTGEHEKPKRCPLCGGRLKQGVATIPFVSGKSVVLIKNVPAEVCQSCHEPYTVGLVTDRITELLKQTYMVPAEISIITYSETQPVAASILG